MANGYVETMKRGCFFAGPREMLMHIYLVDGKSGGAIASRAPRLYNISQQMGLSLHSWQTICSRLRMV